MARFVFAVDNECQTAAGDTKIRLTILCLSGFELYSRWVPLTQAA